MHYQKCFKYVEVHICLAACGYVILFCSTLEMLHNHFKANHEISPGHCENALLLLHIRCPYAQHPADGPSEEFLFRCYPRNVLLEHREEFFISMIPTRCPYGTLERVFYFGLPTRCPYGTFGRFFSFRVTHEMSLWDIGKSF